MKKFHIKKAVSFLLTIVMAFAMLTVATTAEPQAATAIKVTNVSGSSKTLTKGKSFTLKTNYSADKLSFKSSKSSVASVNTKGKITAKAVGTAKITITLKSAKTVKKTITIKVTGKKYTSKDGRFSCKEGRAIGTVDGSTWTAEVSYANRVCEYFGLYGTDISLYFMIDLGQLRTGVQYDTDDFKNQVDGAECYLEYGSVGNLVTYYTASGSGSFDKVKFKVEKWSENKVAAISYVVKIKDGSTYEGFFVAKLGDDEEDDTDQSSSGGSGGSVTVPAPSTGKLTCAVCMGKGYVNCSGGCFGTGMRQCSSCYGTGKYYSYAFGRYAICTRCNGGGKVRCTTCNGSGHKTCPGCNGTGKI